LEEKLVAFADKVSKCAMLAGVACAKSNRVPINDACPDQSAEMRLARNFICAITYLAFEKYVMAYSL
jgi:hypothetical protein